MFANFVHASSEIYLHTLQDDARHRGRSFAGCCQIWPFTRRQRRQQRNGDAPHSGVSYQPPRQALSAK